MNAITISVLAAEEIIDDVCADPFLQAQKSPAPKMLPGGAKFEPFTTAVAVATVIMGAAKVHQASVAVADAISKWLAGGEGSRHEIEVAVRKQDGDFHVLHFEKGTSKQEIRDTVCDYLDA
jgi:hypothetical protein